MIVLCAQIYKRTFFNVPNSAIFLQNQLDAQKMRNLINDKGCVYNFKHKVQMKYEKGTLAMTQSNGYRLK